MAVHVNFPAFFLVCDRADDVFKILARVVAKNGAALNASQNRIPFRISMLAFRPSSTCKEGDEIQMCRHSAQRVLRPLKATKEGVNTNMWCGWGSIQLHIENSIEYSIEFCSTVGHL